MLGNKMRKFFCFSILFFFLVCSCDSNDYQECYEPLYLNETNVEISLLYGSIKDDEIKLDTISIAIGDTIYNTDGGSFPFLHKEGLSTFGPYLYDVLLIFHTTPQKCLAFKDDILPNHDIRSFSSYENLGKCYYCSMRGQSVPDGMLYRITEDLLKQAEPCE